MNIEEYIKSGILELHVSGGLSEEESAEVERMAREHPEIRLELETIEGSFIGYASMHVEKPGNEQFEKILHAIKFPEAITRPINEAVAGGDYEEDNIIPLHPFHERQRQRYISLMAAAVALFLFSSSLNVYFFSRWKNTEKDFVALQQTHQEMAGRLNVTSRQLADANQKIGSYGTQTKLIMLEPVAKGKNYKAVALWNTKMQTLQLKVMGLPKPPDGKQYQLWALVDGKPVDEGMINNMGAMESMKTTPAADAFAITLEKAGGSPTPTLSAMVVMGKVGDNI